MYITRTLTLFLILFLTSCAVGPDFQRPNGQIPTEQQFLNSIKSDENAAYPISHWWERIEDPLLSSYVDELLTENLSLKQASERVIQAKERVNIQNASLFPSLGAGADASRSFSSFTRNGLNCISFPVDGNFKVCNVVFNFGNGIIISYQITVSHLLYMKVTGNFKTSFPAE